MMMLWKSVITKQFPFSTAMPPLAFAVNVKSHITQFPFSNFCTEIAPPFTTPPGRGVVTEFLINRCGLTDEEITKALRHNKRRLRAKSSQNMENVLELLKGCSLTTPAQIRRVVLCYPIIFFRAERNLNAKLSVLRTFMKEEDVTNLFKRDAMIFGASERRLKSRISLLQILGIEGEALSDLLVRGPRLLVVSKERVMELFELAEGFGLKKGSKMFAKAVRALFGLRKESFDRKLQCLSNLGFSEKQISELLRQKPSILDGSEEKMKRNVDFMVRTVGLPLAEFVKYPELFEYSLETRMIPRYSVLEALKSMQVQRSKRGRSFPTIIKLTEERFLEEYVNSNAEFSSVLQDIYGRGKAGKLIIGKETCSEFVSVEKIHESR